jgi:hypothetical protein
MWLKATSPTRASSNRLALSFISRPARHTAHTPRLMDASYSSSGRNVPQMSLPISARATFAMIVLKRFLRDVSAVLGLARILTTQMV